MTTDFILGTAGHIDHGKTSLILALTGTHTDRLPEEKSRGITIELGYACLNLPPFRLGIVDVPGHEKFIRQMLAGASGMDLAMLVVAGDDSINQQTIEHLDILRFLDLSAGVIAITKSDLCDPQWLDLVEEEIRQLVQGTFLETAPIIRTSTETLDGIDDLKRALSESCERAQRRKISNENAPFRMAVDRAFSLEGHGTIVTGSVTSGRLNVGDVLEIQPHQETARVRSIQNHDASTDSVSPGQRAAINLAGVDLQQVSRGHEICAPEFLTPTRLLTVELKLLASNPKPLKPRSQINLHLGTAEIAGQLRCFQTETLSPGGQGFAQIHLAEPIVATWNQPFVIRSPSPAATIGGGRILQPNPRPLKKLTDNDAQQLQALTETEPVNRVLAAIYFSRLGDNSLDKLAALAGVDGLDSILPAILQSERVYQVELTPTQTSLVHRWRIDELADRVLEKLTRLHAQHPLRFAHPLTEIQKQFSYLEHPVLLELAMGQLRSASRINANRNSVSARGHGPQLSKGQKQLMAQLIETLKSSGLEAPGKSDLIKTAQKNKSSVEELLELATANKQIIKISNEIYLHANTFHDALETIRHAMVDSQGMTLSEIRKVLGTSRKYAVPLCETLDQLGLTCRQGDRRVLAEPR